jgi:cell division protein FtsN
MAGTAVIGAFIAIAVAVLVALGVAVYLITRNKSRPKP